MKITQPIWDLPLRLFHWLLVAAVAAAYITGKLGGNLTDWHGRIGGLVLGLLIFRVVWGFIGTTHARFVNFFPTFSRLVAYFKGGWQGTGHTPLGALAVFALLADLAVLVGTGLFAGDDIAYEGPLFNFVDKSVSAKLSGLHSLAFDALALLVVLHVGAIVFYRWVKKTNLVVPMITGKKQASEAAAVSITGGGALRFFATAILSVAIVWGIWGGVELIKSVESAPAPIAKPSF
jgi:cytochrome b